jgi:penicillin G amidase
MKKRLKISGLVFGALSGLLGAAYYYFLKHPQKPMSGSIKLTGLKKPVEIIRDQWGIPHIYAQNEADLFFAQGYIHAQDRLWQMDFNRRFVAGRLAEILGELAVPLDRWLRILGLYRVAEQEICLLDRSAYQALEAYSSGVNSRIQQKRLPLEFNLLRYQPEPWTIVDSLGWAKMMAWNLSGNWEAELTRAQIVNKLGPDLAQSLEPDDMGELCTIISPDHDFSLAINETIEQLEKINRVTGQGPHAGLGSNNWVIAGTRTATGKPILANDMHLGMTAPSIWYENHLVGGPLNLSGISFPGFPGIAVGHNGHIAWGFTNGFPDVQDLYMEHIRKDEKGNITYEFNNEWRTADVRVEEIIVRNAPNIKIDIVKTHHGPVINDLAPDLCGNSSLALCWTALQPGKIANSFSAMIRARNCLEFKEALREFSVHTQNIVYADIDGNIAYSFPGMIPIRSKGDGRLPVPGWNGEFEWSGYIPFEKLPHLLNPQRGYVATANNRVFPDKTYPYWLGKDHVSSNRAARITELIEANDCIDIQYIIRMQQDQISIAARQIKSSIANLRTTDPELMEVLKNLGEWDGSLCPDLPEAAIYEVFLPILLRKILSPTLGDLVERYIGKGPTPILNEESIFGERSREWLQKTLNDRDSHWFESISGQNRETLVLSALKDTLNFLREKQGTNRERWTWGKLHQLTFAHSLGGVKPFGKLFNRGPFPIGGDFDTIWATGNSYHDLEAVRMTSAPFRFIADLSNLDRSLGCLVPGQSGLPTNKHYDDQIDDWFNGRYHPMLYLRVSVEKFRKSTLELLPA